MLKSIYPSAQLRTVHVILSGVLSEHPNQDTLNESRTVSILSYLSSSKEKHPVLGDGFTCGSLSS